MKRGTPRHPKVLELASLLDIPKYSAVGLLEMLWHFTAEFALDGDIGKFSDAAIAQALSYDGASTVLVSCLIHTRFLDMCECHRLRVHDWPDHADQTVRRVLAKRNQGFIPCYDDPSTMLAPSKMPKAYCLKPKANTKEDIYITQVHGDVRAREEYIKSGKKTYTEDFLTFWRAYPKKTGKKAAFKAWTAASKDGLPDLEIVVKAIQAQCKSRQWQDEQFIPLPATWLNQGRWDDEVKSNEPDEWTGDWGESEYPTKSEMDRMTAQERTYWQNRMRLERTMSDDE
jgi:hypothetical protein